MISSGATTVTFLLFAGMVPGSRNCLHVIDEIHAIRSPSSVSGLRLSFTMRLPDGNFLQVLKSLSPISWFEPVTPVVPAAGGVPDGVVGAAPGVGGVPGVGRRFPSGPPGKPGNAPGVRGVGIGAGGAGTVAAGGADSPGLTRTGLPSGPVTTAARSGLAPRRTASTAATRSIVRLFIGCCSPW